MSASPPEKRIELEKLKADGLLMLVRSGDHIRHWTAREIASDWLGYRGASAVARRAMRARIALEVQLIYPLLEEGGLHPLRHSFRGSSDHV